MRSILMIVLLLASAMAMSCSRGYEPINYGGDACAHCKMTVVDDRYAAELVTSKGKVYKFDDVVCLKHFETSLEAGGTHLYFVEDYLKKNISAIDAENALYLKHEFFRSPMNGGYAAFESEADAQRFSDSLNTPLLKWENLN